MFRRLIVILVAALASLLPASESVSATAVIVDGAYTYDVPIEQRADASARALDLDSALARRAWEGVAGTTTSAAARYTYDARTSTRVDNCAIGVACAATNQLSNALEVSALLSVEGHGASTAPSVAFVATNTGSRGLSNLGGIIEETGTNAAGGRIFTSTGAINQNDFRGIVNAGLTRGDDVHILTGAHGLPNGSIVADAGLLADDVRAFGDLPGVHIYDLPSMTPAEVQAVLDGPGTIIGGFCDSGACLRPGG